MEPIEELVYWIKEREKIRDLKERGKPKPWSDDPVFQGVYFCNVHREDDKVTKWIRNHWKFEGVTQAEYDLMMCVARWLNWPDTLALLDIPIDLNKMRAVLKNKEGKVWGNAYVVTTHGRKMNKVDWLLEAARAAQGHLPIPYHCATLAAAHAHLKGIDGLADFMAAQVVADLKNTPQHPLFYAKDWWNWSAPGPGSLRGLSWVHGRLITKRHYEEMMKELHPKIEELVYPIHMCEQDLQNCLCEFDKYMRVKNGTGRSKRLYNGH